MSFTCLDVNGKPVKDAVHSGGQVYVSNHGNALNGFYTCSCTDANYASPYSYSGQYQNGRKHGIGLFKTEDGSKQGIFHEGVFAEGIWKEGGTAYEGKFVNVYLEGQGKKTLSNGTIYAGDFKRDKLEGAGTRTLPNGTVDTGNFRKNILSGCGTRKLVSGEIIEGKFSDGPGDFKFTPDVESEEPDSEAEEPDVESDDSEAEEPDQGPKKIHVNGKWGHFIPLNGIHTTPNSSGVHQYTGEFKDGDFHGEGRMGDDNNYKQGTFFKGTFAQGKWMYSDRLYKGTFVENRLEGIGTMTMDGEVYSGTFKNDKLNGPGTLKMENGDLLEGMFADTLLEGVVIKTLANGRKQKCVFKSGKQTETLPDDTVEKPAEKKIKRKVRRKVVYENEDDAEPIIDEEVIDEEVDDDQSPADKLIAELRADVTELKATLQKMLTKKIASFE